MNRDLRLVYGAVADIACVTTHVLCGAGPVTVAMLIPKAMLIPNAAIAFEKQIELGWV